MKHDHVCARARMLMVMVMQLKSEKKEGKKEQRVPDWT